MKKTIVYGIIILFIAQIAGCTSIYRYVRNKRNRNYTEGVTLYKQRNFEEAHDRFETVVDIEPTYKNARSYFRKTTRILRLKERKIKQRANKNYYTGLRQMRRRRYERALNYFLIVRKQDPDHIEVEDKIDECREKLQPQFNRTVRTAEKLYTRRRYIQAYKTYLRAKRLNPSGLSGLRNKITDKLEDRSEPFKDRAEDLYDNKRYKAAQKQAKRAIRVHPWDEDARELLNKCNAWINLDKNYKAGIKNFRRRKYFVAKGKFNRVKRIAPGYKGTENYLSRIDNILKRKVGSYYSRGVSLYGRGNYKGAIREFNRVLAINSSHKQAIEYRTRAKSKLQFKQSIGGK